MSKIYFYVDDICFNLTTGSLDSYSIWPLEARAVLICHPGAPTLRRKGVTSNVMYQNTVRSRSLRYHTGRRLRAYGANRPRLYAAQ